MRTMKHFMSWLKNGLEGSDYILLLFLVLLFFWTVIIVIKWKSREKSKKAEVVDSILNTIRTDDKIQRFMNRIETNEEWYDISFFEDYSLKKEVYDVLSYYNYICYLAEKHVISMDEYLLFEYSLQKIASNSSFQNYMFQLFHESERENKTFPFYNLLEGCVEKMPGGFLDSESENYKEVEKK